MDFWYKGIPKFPGKFRLAHTTTIAHAEEIPFEMMGAVLNSKE